MAKYSGAESFRRAEDQGHDIMVKTLEAAAKKQAPLKECAKDNCDCAEDFIESEVVDFPDYP